MLGRRSRVSACSAIPTGTHLVRGSAGAIAAIAPGPSGRTGIVAGIIGVGGGGGRTARTSHAARSQDRADRPIRVVHYRGRSIGAVRAVAASLVVGCAIGAYSRHGNRSGQQDVSCTSARKRLVDHSSLAPLEPGKYLAFHPRTATKFAAAIEFIAKSRHSRD